ncbi:MAG: hypothetical protein AB7F35_12190 [Acetobacteraceae bacterium]
MDAKLDLILSEIRDIKTAVAAQANGLSSILQAVKTLADRMDNAAEGSDALDDLFATLAEIKQGVDAIRSALKPDGC